MSQPFAGLVALRSCEEPAGPLVKASGDPSLACYTYTAVQQTVV